MNMKMMKAACIGLAATALAFCPLVGVRSAHAQANAAVKALPPISLDLRDAPIRQALEQLFTNGGVQFSIDNSVTGYITLKIQDQPFESALRLIMRASSVPLTYTLEGGVYFVKPRPLVTAPVVDTAPPPDVNNNTQQKQYLPLEQIQLVYADPYDLVGILGIQVLTNFQRGGSSSGRGGGGGLGGGLGGGMGGLGGMMGGGMGGMMGGGLGSMMGGGLGGGMGSMGGMMGGSMGGLGGGMGGGFR